MLFQNTKQHIIHPPQKVHFPEERWEFRNCVFSNNERVLLGKKGGRDLLYTVGYICY